MRKVSGQYRSVSWQRHHWGIDLTYWPNGSAYPVRRKYIGNGSDPMTVRESVASFLSDIRLGRI